jgi:hypothetical protein
MHSLQPGSPVRRSLISPSGRWGCKSVQDLPDLEKTNVIIDITNVAEPVTFLVFFYILVRLAPHSSSGSSLKNDYYGKLNKMKTDSVFFGFPGYSNEFP